LGVGRPFLSFFVKGEGCVPSETINVSAIGSLHFARRYLGKKCLTGATIKAPDILLESRHSYAMPRRSNCFLRRSLINNWEPNSSCARTSDVSLLEKPQQAQTAVHHLGSSD
jgi:hypothetical protein